MRFIELARDVWIGDREACDARGPDFPLVIHAWSDLNIAEGRLCECLARSCGRGLPVKYSEGHLLAEADRPIGVVADYARRQGRILCHCAGCAVRGPTFGLLALAARGVSPFDAIPLLYRAMWAACRMPPCLFDRPVAEIISWWEARPR